MDENKVDDVVKDDTVQTEVNPPQAGKALVPMTRQEVRSLVVGAIRSAIGDQRQSIGVSMNWLTKHVEELNLKADDVEALIAVRIEFGGLLPHAVKFLYQGLTAQDVCGCYQARNTLGLMEYAASVKKIARLISTFAEADPGNEGLGEMIADAHAVISNRYPWVQYVDQSISILCAIQEKYGCVTIEAALSMIESRRAKEMGMVSDDERDEVETHRGNYEESRYQRGG